MILLEDLNTGSVIDGNELEFIIDDETSIGEVYLDDELIFQELDVINERQLRLMFFQNWTQLDTDVEFEYA